MPVKDTKKKSNAPKKPEPSSKDILEQNEMGVIKIHEDVVGDVVRKAVTLLKDTVVVESGSIVDNIAGMLGGREKGGIGIDMHEDHVNVALKVDIVYGESIPSTAQKLQSTVQKEVLKITGMKVKQVDVIVQKLISKEEIKKDEKKPAPPKKKETPPKKETKKEDKK